MFNEPAAEGVDWALFATYVGLFVALLGIFVQVRASFVLAKISSIESRLNSFYGPFYLLRIKSSALYKKLKAANVENPSDRFSLLEALLNGHQFSKNDQALIAEIIAIGTKCEELISSSLGYLEQGELRDVLLPEASNHYRIIRLVHEGQISGEVSRFKDMTFKAEKLDSALRAKLESVQIDVARERGRLSILGWLGID